jgi:penicillin amidase
MVKKSFFFSFIFLFLIVFGLYFVLNGSKPHVMGTESLIGLAKTVVVERDHFGVPVLHGHSRRDIARATGYIHAQDRFFQMDLTRRMAAGELSEIFGEAALEIDKEKRIHCFRAQATIALPTLTPFEQELLLAYAEGVNSGIKALRFKPFEYFILGVDPEPWKPEDTILVGYSLFIDLQDPLGSVDWSRGILKAYLPSAVYDFFVKNGSVWESPLEKTKHPFLPIPKEDHFSYLTTMEEQSVNLDSTRAVGSNQWAICPTQSLSNRSLLACDMHLNHRVPTTWYRLGFDCFDEAQNPIQMDGVSLPGTPFIAAGSNRKIAWGFTNSFVDTTDLVLVDIDPKDPKFYLTPEGPTPFEERIEEIKIKGQPPLQYVIKWTKWGPLYPELYLGQPVAIRWQAHDFDSFNCKLVDLEAVATTKDALKALPGIHLPSLNFMVADKDGHIGWSLVGGIPIREGYSPGLPVSFTDGSKRWIGTRESNEQYSMIDPPDGCLWTANNRVVDDEESLGIDFVNGIRAFQIEKKLLSKDQHSVDDFVALQLDDEALFFKRWQSLLLNSLDVNNGEHQQLYRRLSNWDGHASADSREYFFIRSFRQKLMERILGRIFAPCYQAYPSLKISFLALEEPVYRIALEQPSYLADRHLGWKREFHLIVNELLKEDTSKPWGVYNAVAIQHPLSRFIPFSSYLLDMPKDPQCGDYYVPRATGPAFGASMRIVVSPGYEEEGIINLPCGQSGHPLSPHYSDQHQAWAEGKPTPFLAGPPIYRLTLHPQD